MDHSVIMKLTGHKTAAMFHRYNTVDTADAREADQKFEGLLAQQQEEVTPGKLYSGTKKCSHQQKKVAAATVSTWNSWRRHPDSNRRITVLQTAALPLGYAASGAGNGI